MNLVNLFDLSLIGKKNKPALEFNNETFTFEEINLGSNRMARWLLKKNLVAGDRLCIYLENSVEIIDIFIACAKTGIIFVPINILYKEREISHILKDAAPKLVIANGELPGGFTCWQLNDLKSEVRNQKSDNIPVRTTGDSPVAIVYTSGTTGNSKGAILTHNNFIANGLNLVTCWQVTENDRLLLALPLFHAHALANGLHVWLLSGCLMKLIVRFEHQKASEDFLSFKPSLFFGVPTIYIRLLEQPDNIAQQIGSFMRLFVSGSSPLPAQVLEAFNKKYGHVILERYGMTETLMNMSNPYIGERRAGTVGFPLPGISVKILKTDGTTAVVCEEGELYIKGPNVFSAYWKREQATSEMFIGGYFKTGDIAVVSDDGYFTLRGRKSDLIISGGFNIYPREIEEFLQEQEGVAEAAVVGVPHDIRGEVPVAYIVPKEKYDAANIEEKCKKTFASFKIPRAFIIIDKIPRTALGKVQKHLLSKLNK